jgi:hypothetical protein
MSSHPRFLLTDNDYNARGAVDRDAGRWIGHDTTGRILFNRKDQAGAEAATKKLGFRFVTTGWYGLRDAGTDMPAPDAMRRRDERAAERAAAPPVSWWGAS